MKHVLLSHTLIEEKIFSECANLIESKVLLRSCNALYRFLEAHDCATVIIDEIVLNHNKSSITHDLQNLYDTILKNNPKCLIVLLYRNYAGPVSQLKKKSHYTILIKKESFTIQKLEYIFAVHMHQDYRALFIKDLRPETKAPIDLHIYHPLNQDYPCFIPKGTDIKKEILERLEKDNVSQLFIKTGEFGDFLKMSENIYHLYFSEEMHHIRKRYKYFLSDMVEDTEREGWKKGRYLLDELNLIYNKTSRLIDKFRKPELALKSLIFLRQSAITQGLNSGIYAIVFTRLLGLKNEEELFYSALLYGLGKSEVPSQGEVRTNLDNINLSIRASYLRYVDHSIKIVKKGKILVSPQIIENIEGHKEYFDGSGYPLGLMGDEIPRGAQLLGIIEAFSNLYTFRQNEKFLSFKRAWLTLRENSKNAINGAKHSPRLLDEIQQRLKNKDIL
jgi:response regulator RpfG family c-di-GMP phosphodiesterase